MLKILFQLEGACCDGVYSIEQNSCSFLQKQRPYASLRWLRGTSRGGNLGGLEGTASSCNFIKYDNDQEVNHDFHASFGKFFILLKVFDVFSTI